MTSRVSQTKAAFFSKSPNSSIFPASYMTIWRGTGYCSNIHKIKALLKDYTKEDFFLGSFLGCLFFGHWGRHHISEVHKIIQTKYECMDDILYDLRLLKPNEGGSLHRRIEFIDKQTSLDLTPFYSL